MALVEAGVRAAAPTVLRACPRLRKDIEALGREALARTAKLDLEIGLSGYETKVYVPDDAGYAILLSSSPLSDVSLRLSLIHVAVWSSRSGGTFAWAHHVVDDTRLEPLRGAEGEHAELVLAPVVNADDLQSFGLAALAMDRLGGLGVLRHGVDHRSSSWRFDIISSWSRQSTQ